MRLVNVFPVNVVDFRGPIYKESYEFRKIVVFHKSYEVRKIDLRIFVNRAPGLYCHLRQQIRLVDLSEQWRVPITHSQFIIIVNFQP